MPKNNPLKILIIQTAFIGDVILATAVIEKIHRFYPEAKVDFLLRKGNESLLENHPKLNAVLIWDKQGNKYKNLWKIIKNVRGNDYDKVINLHRFSSSGMITKFSGAKEKIGFDKNPWSWTFTKKVKHVIGNREDEKYLHEVERNLLLVSDFTNPDFEKPKLYPSEQDFEKVKSYKKEKYITMAPASVWKTKQLPHLQWDKLINDLFEYKIYLLGAPGDLPFLQEMKGITIHPNLEVLGGDLSLLQSAALMQDAVMNYVNDSAPLHLCSAMDAPVTVFYCSTIPEFGFGPLSTNSKVVEVENEMDCRPCGLHGHQECPKGHFDCGYKIEIPLLQ